MKRFKYTQVSRKRVFSEVELNEYGEHGWDLVSILIINGAYSYTFKREDVPFEDAKKQSDNDNCEYGIVYDNTFIRTIKGVHELGLLSVRCCTALRAIGIETINDLKACVDPIGKCKKKGNFGKMSVKELEDFLETQLFEKRTTANKE